AIVRSYDEPRPVVQLPITPGAEDTAPTPENEIAYIDEVVQALSRWDKDSLKPLLAPETLAGATDEQLDQVLGTLGRRLGELRSYEQPAAQPRMTQPGEPENLSAYRLVAYYDKGEADVSLVLKQSGSTPQVYAFNVEVAQPL